MLQPAQPDGQVMQLASPPHMAPFALGTFKRGSQWIDRGERAGDDHYPSLRRRFGAPVGADPAGRRHLLDRRCVDTRMANATGT